MPSDACRPSPVESGKGVIQPPTMSFSEIDAGCRKILHNLWSIVCTTFGKTKIGRVRSGWKCQGTMSQGGSLSSNLTCSHLLEWTYYVWFRPDDHIWPLALSCDLSKVTRATGRATSGCSEMGEVVIESSRRVFFNGFWVSLKRSQVSSYVKIVTFRTLDCQDGTKNSCEHKLCQNYWQETKKVLFEFISYMKQSSSQICSPNENTAQVSCDHFTGHLERRIWWWHLFLNLAWGKVNFRSS